VSREAAQQSVTLSFVARVNHLKEEQVKISIWNQNTQELIPGSSLISAIRPERFYPGCLISVVGAGGKTSTILEMAKEASCRGDRVIVTTTTHMQHPVENGYIWQNGPAGKERAAIRAAMKEHPYVIAGKEGSPTRIESLPDDLLQGLMEDCDLLLSEADGARRMPIKAPREYEPVIPDKTQIIIICIGLDAIGQNLDDCTCRKEEMLRLPGIDGNKPVTEEAAARTLYYGYREPLSKVYRNASFYYIMNKADNEARIKSAAAVCRLLEDLESNGTGDAEGYFVTSYEKREGVIDGL